MNRILVTLPNWYGETLFTTPFLRALRQQMPTAFIATLGRPQCKEVLLQNPHITEFLDYDERGAHRSLSGKWQVVSTLRERRFDAAFILRKSLSRSVMLCAAGIPTRVGFANPKSGWLLTHRVPAAGAARHKASTYLPFLEAVGLSVLAGPYEYTVSDEERQVARQWLSAQRSENGRPVVVLHPGANWPHKRWAPERFAALGDRLVESQRVHVVITGGPADAALADAVKHRMRHPAVVIAGQTTLRQLAAVLEQAQLIVSNDTGILHVAAALRRPVVALYGPTSSALTGPLGEPQRIAIVHHADCCPHVPCYQPDHPPHPGMDAITVEEVYQAACQLLSSGKLKVESGPS
jgi:heptosyltransferase-2